MRRIRGVFTRLEILYSQETQWWGLLTKTPDTSSDWPGLTSETSKNHGYFHPFWRNFHPKFRYLTESPIKAGRGGWATRGVPCARFLVCPIINNTITKTVFSVAFFHYWPHGTSPRYSRRRVFVLFLMYL